MDIDSLKTISKQDFTLIISKFLRDIDFHPPRHSYDLSIQSSITSYFSAQHTWPAHLRSRAVKVADPISIGVALCYPHAPHSTRLAYALHGCYVLFIDDISTDLGNALDEFSSRLIEGREQASPILQSFVAFLRTELRAQVGPYAFTMILKSTLEFINGLVFERTYNNTLQIPTGAVNFPAYLRIVTGYSEPYAHFIFHQTQFPEKEWLEAYLPIVPDLIDFINYTNDLVSFCKESVVGNERLNYVCNVAATRGVGVEEALGIVAGRIGEAMGRVRMVVREGEMREVVEDFFRAYVMFHLEQPRYGLVDVVGEFVKDGDEGGKWDGVVVKL